MAQAATPYVYSRSYSAYHGPDSVIVKDQLAALQSFWQTFGAYQFAQQWLWILRKNPEKGETDPLAGTFGHWNKRLVPFVHNRIQRDLDENLLPYSRNILLKPRQAGYTTYTLLMRLFCMALLEPGSGNLLVSQTHRDAARHFAMLRRAHRYFGAVDPYNPEVNEASLLLHEHLLHTAYSSRREIVYDQLDSRVMCESAEIEEVGQGITLNHVVCTEVARWPGNPEETMANMKEAIAKDGTLDLESTANGWGGYFHSECMRARDPKVPQSEKEFRYHFHEWWWHEEYRDEKPVDPDTLKDDELRLQMRAKLDLFQIRWRRKKMVSLRHNFAEKYPEDDISCFILTGGAYFDNEVLRERMEELLAYQPLIEKKKVKIFKRRQGRHRRYVIGADPVQGLPAAKKGGQVVGDKNLDFAAAVVIDLETGEEMAAYRARVLPETFAQDLAELGRLYNNAEIAVERTGDGGTVITQLKTACQYMNVFLHKDWWKRDKSKGNVPEFEGVPITQRTRPLLLNRVRYFAREHPERIWDLTFIEEAMNFTYNDKGKPEHADGCHDDTVLCRGHAYYLRAVRHGYLDPAAIPRVERYGETPVEFRSDDESELEESEE